MKNLAIRTKQQFSNAKIIAEYLSKHPKIKKVYYPNLENPNLTDGFGSMLSVDIGNEKKALDFVHNLKMIEHAVSLGGVETILCFPNKTSLSVEERKRLGLTDSLLRLSVGIEDVDDIIADLEQALASIE